MKEISFTVDGQNLVGTLLLPEKVKEKNPAVLFIHGWQSSQKRAIERAGVLVKLGFICMTFDLRSHGESEGDGEQLSIDNYLNDVASAYDFLKQQKNVDPDRIGVVGSSFGGYLGTLVTGKRKVKWLALQAPANYPDEGFYDPKPKIVSTDVIDWRGKKKLHNQTRSLSALHQFKNEILIIEAEDDDLVPHQTLQNYKNAVKNKEQLTYICIAGADHSLKINNSNEKYMQILSDWFKDK